MVKVEKLSNDVPVQIPVPEEEVAVIAGGAVTVAITGVLAAEQPAV
jgi:hypothetical protein